MKPTSSSTDPLGAVIYVRVSDEKQAKTDVDGGYSLSVQKQLSRLKAKELGASFTKVFVEPGHTATTMRRPQLDAAIDRAKKPDVGWFIVHKVNRFARNATDGLRIADELRDAGTELVSVSESWDATPAGRLMKTLYFGLAEMYSAELSEEVTTKMAEKARRGGTPGMCPPGYLNVRTTVDGMANVARVAVDPDRAEHIRWAFATFAEGHDTVNSLREKLTRRGFTLRKTKRYPERPVSKSALTKLLRNPYYTGIVTWGGKQYRGEHEQLVDVGTFDKVQRVLDGNNTGGDKSWRYRHYLKGTLHCGYCSERLGLIHGRGNGGEYQYFYCLGRQKRNGCPQRYIPTWMAEAAVEDHYRVVRQKVDDVLPEIELAFREVLSAFDETAATETDRLHRRKARLEREQRKLLHLAYDDELPDDLVKQEINRLSREASELDQQIEAASVNVGDLRDRFEQLCHLVGEIDRTYQNASDDTRRDFNRFWFASLSITDDRITDHELADLPAIVLDDSAPQRLREGAQVFHRQTEDAQWRSLVDELRNEEPDTHWVPGSNVAYLVAGAGFEPATFGL